MITEQIDAVMQQFDFEAWKGINRLDRELEIHDIALPEDLIDGLNPKRMRRIDPGDGSRLLRVTWPVPDQESALITMDIRECASREAAHRVLLELLANMQAPDVKRLGEDAPGDIAFGRDATKALAFARGNIVLSISNGGNKIVPVDGIARAIDQWMIEPSPIRTS